MRVSPDPRFIIQEASPHIGEGLFAAVPIARKDFILEYTGVRLPSDTAEETGSRYLFEIDDTWTIDGADESNTARYINHSCNPNVEAEIDDGRIMIYAKRKIKAGEELTIDYGEEYFDEFIKPGGCRCRTCVNGTPAASSK